MTNIKAHCHQYFCTVCGESLKPHECNHDWHYQDDKRICRICDRWELRSVEDIKKYEESCHLTIPGVVEAFLNKYLELDNASFEECMQEIVRLKKGNKHNGLK